MLRAVRRRLPARVTNITLLVVLALAFATGAGAVASGSARARWVVLTHGVAGVLVVVLAPAKTRVARVGLRLRRPTRYASLVLAALTVATLVVGVLHSTGLLRSLAGLPALWFHIALAFAVVPLAVWHVAIRRARPRRADLSRRTLLRTGSLVALATGLYAAVTTGTDAAGLPGSRRRFTGSYETASFEPARMPPTSWLVDAVPAVDPSAWRLQVVDARGSRELALGDLTVGDVRWRALLDCTSGWYSVQDWQGVAVSTLLPDRAGARSLLVRSLTGFWVRFPIEDADRLLLATAVGGAALTPAHGFPLRLVAPGRRGYWWVKWVDRIELSGDPWWWQPPFPLG